MSTTIKHFKAKEIKELRNKGKQDLLKQLDELKKELHGLRVAQVAAGAPAKVAQIRAVRKNIARINTILMQITKQKVRESYRKRKSSLLPLDLRPRLTRRERLRLPQELRFKKCKRARKRIQRYPQRKFAVINLSRKLPIEVRKQNVRNALSGKKPGNVYYQHVRRTSKLRRRLRYMTRQQRKKRREEAKNEQKEN